MVSKQEVTETLTTRKCYTKGKDKLSVFRLMDRSNSNFDHFRMCNDGKIAARCVFHYL
jgi:hypothetical protein